MIDLSIIVPVYKGKKYIKETIESILPISCTKEIIIVDDGSPDDSYDYCKKLFKDRPEVQIVRKKNGGIVDTRNFGLKIAKGQFVMFSDQDDICYYETIEKAIAVAKSNGVDMVYWSTVCLLEDGQLTPRDVVTENTIISKDEIHNTMIKDMLMNVDNTYISYIGHVWSALYRRDVIEQYSICFKRFVDIEDDYLFLLDFMLLANTIAFVKDVGYAWRYNRKSETYRIKHIEQFISKYTDFYNYILTAVSNVNFEKNVLIRFDQYMKQELMIRAIENSFTYLVKSQNEKKEVKMLYKNLKTYFDMKSIAPYNKRRKRIFSLLSNNLFIVAGWYVYMDSFYRKMKISRK